MTLSGGRFSAITFNVLSGSNNSNSTITIAASGALLQLSFAGTETVDKLLIGTSGLTYAIQDSADLGVTNPWAEVPAGPSYINEATTISYSLTAGIPVTNFLRLQVLSN